MSNYSYCGIDLAKNHFSVHTINPHGKVILHKNVTRSKLLNTIAKLPTMRIGLEAFGGAHYWARTFNQLAHDCRIMAAKQAASLIGVAPMTKESGRYKGKRIIQGGRAQVRTVLYMAMMSAMQCNPIFKATYTRLVAAGKPQKVAIIACVRKMVVILNSMLRDGVIWDENIARN
ncbi:transposase [Vibrio sp. FNV 38]|nr:transposase [Vibrio sp. FNV 38]